MAANEIILETDEELIDTWPLLYTPPGGKNYEVRCMITNKRIMYGPGTEIGMTDELNEMAETFDGGRKWLVISKERILNIEPKRSYLEKSIILTLDNGQQHKFSYGALNIDKLVEAISLTGENPPKIP
jgi:hypothetical protein